jgi:hypothetical protein
MQLITMFNSDPVDESKDYLEDFQGVFKLLVEDQMLAENAFAKVAKRAFRDQLNLRAKIRMIQQDELLRAPLWSVSASVALYSFPGHIPDAGALVHLTSILSESLSVSSGGKQVVLPAPLVSSISEVSKSLYSFSLKQKWGFSDD